jgi:UDP-3-O-[3-hydroxymyristoyl] glucosamine N-acyltransferase
MQILHGDRYMPPRGIHPTAVIGRGVRLGDRISIGPYVIIEDDAVIEDDVVVRAGSFIGAETTIGEGSYIYPNVVVRERSRVGRNNIIHAGAVIGDDGFGFVKEGDQHRKMPQLGRTILGDNVEIGSNTCIDRATIGETVVGDGSRIDNLVQIGHNVRVGRNVVLCAQVGIAGSCEIGDEVTMAGQVGVSGHLQIGKGTKIGAQAGVIKHIPPGSRVSGYPARPHTEAMRVIAATWRLPELLRRIEELEARLAALEAPGFEPKR